MSEVRRKGEWLLLGFPGDLTMTEVPQEVYLRQFRDTPADDLDALAELCQLGKIRTTNPHDPFGDLPISSPEMWTRELAQLSANLWQGEIAWFGDEQERERIWSEHPPDMPSFFPVHVSEVAYRVRCIQRVTDHLLRYLSGEPLEPAWRACDNELEAWGRFVSLTGSALHGFHVRVVVQAPGDPAEEFAFGDPYPSLYSAAMLQLVNDLASEETVRTCANEMCPGPGGRPRQFIRQLGRSVHGGNRKIGVMYCSSTCARAQYQREKRRRDRAQKGGAE